MKKAKLALVFLVPIMFLSVIFGFGFSIPKTQASASELKKFDIRVDDYPVYIKYSKDVRAYDDYVQEYFVFENDDFIVSRTDPGEYNKNRYRYNGRLIYLAQAYAHPESGEPYADPYFNAGKGVYDLKITASDVHKEYEACEFYVENFFVVMDEEGMDIPEFSAVYNGKSQTATIPAGAKYTAVTNAGGTDVGEYEVVLKSKNVDVFFWNGLADKTQDAVTTTFKILKETNNQITDLSITPWTHGNYDSQLNTPTAKSTVGDIIYTYYDSNSNMVNIATAGPGRYTLVATVAQTENYNSATAQIEFEIGKQIIQVPATDTTIFEYDGNKKTYTIEPNSAYVVSGNVQTNAGTYVVEIALIDPSNWQWSNGTSDNLHYTFVIQKQEVTSPIVNYKEYNGQTQVADVVDNYLYCVVEGTGNLGGINVGRYDVFYQLKYPQNYRWDVDEDGTQPILKLVFEIVKNNSNYIEDLAIENWQYKSYNQAANQPTARCAFGTIEYFYKDQNGQIVSDIANAPVGKYMLCASIQETENYGGASRQIEFWILKKQILGAWKTKNGYTYFDLKIAADADQFEIRYYDQNNNEVELSKLVKNKKYTAKLTLKDADNYEIIESKNNNYVLATTEKTFTYTQKSSSWWIYLMVIGAVLAVAAVGAFVCYKRKKKNAAVAQNPNMAQAENTQATTKKQPQTNTSKQTTKPKTGSVAQKPAATKDKN